MRVKRKHKKLIAKLLLCCMAVINLPIHSLLHQHSVDEHTHSHHCKDHKKHTEVSEAHDCFACIILKIDNTFVEQAQLSIPDIGFAQTFFEDLTPQYFTLVKVSNSRAPPVFA